MVLKVTVYPSYLKKNKKMFFKVILQKKTWIFQCEDFFLNFITGKMTSFQKLVLSLFNSANCLNWSFTQLRMKVSYVNYIKNVNPLFNPFVTHSRSANNII